MNTNPSEHLIDSRLILIRALVASKSWMYQYATAFVDSYVEGMQQTSLKGEPVNMCRVAQFKLDELKNQGYRVNGYAIQKMGSGNLWQRGMVNDGGMVCWWHDEPLDLKKEQSTSVVSQAYDTRQFSNLTNQAHGYSQPVHPADEPVAEIIVCSVMGQQTIAEIEGRLKYLRIGDKLYTQPQESHPAELNPWKEAMLDGLTSACIDSPISDSPRTILDKIVRANVCFATDPEINSKAAKIHIESLLFTLRHTKVGEDRGAAHDKIVDAFVEAATTKLVQKDDSVLQKRYDELIYAVGMKWPNENRHETALRYIRKAETINTDSGNGCAVRDKNETL